MDASSSSQTLNHDQSTFDYDYDVAFLFRDLGLETESTSYGLNSIRTLQDDVVNASSNMDLYPAFTPFEGVIKPKGIETLDNYGLYFNYQDYTPEKILNCLQEARKGIYTPKIETLFCILRGYIFSLMTDETMHHIFQTFLAVCEGQRLSSLVQEILWRRELFIDAAFSRHGVTSIGILMEKLNWTAHAFTVTEILSTRFFDMMTHHTARNVILQCFNLFGPAPNEILFEKTIIHFKELATDAFGYIALTACIDAITGEQRSRLLFNIAQVSNYLANDPYGNFIVQHVLKLRKGDVTMQILRCLEGEIVQLAMGKNGSHVVETCMECCGIGLHFVLRKILYGTTTPGALVQLAKSQFGNYVIQKALRMTKERGLESVYRCIVQSLEPYYMELERSAGGKKVIDLIFSGTTYYYTG